MNRKNKKIVLSGIVLIFIIGLIILNFNFKTILGVFLLMYNLGLMYKFRKNKKMFFLFLVLFYFNYSFCITKYIGTESNLLSAVYGQLQNESSYIICIAQQIIFLVILDILISKKNNSLNVYENEITNFKYRKVLIYLLDSFLVFTLLYHIINKITVNTAWFEYSIYIFIFALYFTKQDKHLKIFTELILVAFSIYSLKNGDRIAVLQFLIVDFLINYINKFSMKKILLAMISGILIFTFLGLYGDILDFSKDFEKLNVEYTINKIKERRFALDTSVSAYFSGLSIVDLRNISQLIFLQNSDQQNYYNIRFLYHLK